MKPVYQTHFGAPGGNCFQAAMASIFDLPLEAVPDFCMLYDDDTWWNEVIKFCMDRGLFPLTVSSDAILPQDRVIFHLALGITAKGHNHAVVYANGNLIHDPIGGPGPGLAEVQQFVFFVAPMVGSC